MALEKVKGARIAPQQTESTPAWLLSQLGSGLTSAAKGASSLIGGLETVANLPTTGLALLIDYISGGKTPVKALLKEGLPETLKGPLQDAPEMLPERFRREPTTASEYLIQRGIGQLPFLLAGGINPQTLTRSGIGLLGATAAQQAGVGPLGQDIAQLLAEGGVARAMRPSLKQKAAMGYTLAGEEGPGAFTATVKETAPLDKVISKLERLSSVQVKPEHKNILENLYSSLQSTKTFHEADLGKLFEARTALGKAYKDLNKTGYSALAHETREALNQIIKGAEAKLKAPLFWNSVTTGDRYKIAENIRTHLVDNMSRFVENLPKLPFNIQKSLNLITMGVRPFEKFVRSMNNAEYRKHAIDLMTALDEGKNKDIAKYALSFSKAMKKEEGEQKPSLKKLTRIEGARLIQ